MSKTLSGPKLCSQIQRSCWSPGMTTLSVPRIVSNGPTSAGSHVHANDRGGVLADAAERHHQVLEVCALDDVELEVVVGAGADGEDAGLRCRAHAPYRTTDTDAACNCRHVTLAIFLTACQDSPH